MDRRAKCHDDFAGRFDWLLAPLCSVSRETPIWLAELWILSGAFVVQKSVESEPSEVDMPSNVIDINEELNARTGQDYLSTAQRAFHDSFADFAEETAGVITFPDGWIDEKAKLAAELLADLDGPVSIQTSVRVDVHLTEDQQAAMRRALQDQAHQIVKTMQDRAREIVARRVLQIAMPLAD